MLSHTDRAVIGMHESAAVSLCELPTEDFGTGFFAVHTDQHYLVTNCHALPTQAAVAHAEVLLYYCKRGKPSTKVELKELAAGQDPPFFGLTLDEAKDLAQIKVPDLTVVPITLPDGVSRPFVLARAKPPRPRSVHTFQHPGGGPLLLDPGVGKRRGMFHFVDNNTDVGSSGSPVLSIARDKAELIAVHVGNPQSKGNGGIHHALHLCAELDDLLRDGVAPRAGLGRDSVSCADIHPPG